MKRISILCVLLTVTTLSCSKKDVELEIPACILEMVSELEAKDDVPEGVNISVYLFQKRHVYVRDVGTAALVYDKDCNSIGLLGGFSGNTTINGDDFANAKLIREIWRSTPD